MTKIVLIHQTVWSYIQYCGIKAPFFYFPRRLSYQSYDLCNLFPKFIIFNYCIISKFCVLIIRIQLDLKVSNSLKNPIAQKYLKLFLVFRICCVSISEHPPISLYSTGLSSLTKKKLNKIDTRSASKVSPDPAISILAGFPATILATSEFKRMASFGMSENEIDGATWVWWFHAHVS